MAAGGGRPCGRLFLPAGGTLLCLLTGCAGEISKDAVAHIQCPICAMAVQEAQRFATENKITDEEGLTDLVDSLCSLKRKEGRWSQRLDLTRELEKPPIVLLLQGWLESWLPEWVFTSLTKALTMVEPDEANLPLRVVRTGRLGECHGECRTIHRACKQLLKGKEEKLVSMLQQSKDVVAILEALCKKTCDKKPLPKLEKWVDEKFTPRDEQDVETEDLILKMKEETGMSMKMYKREDMLSMSEGDMETMAAREAYAQERQAAKFQSEL